LEEKETKDIIKQFKNDPYSIWLRMIHWRVIEGELVLCAGGIFEQSEYDRVLKYFRTKKLIK
jgi:hypothetical protein